MKNIHVLPTDKPSRLSILNSGKLNFGAEIISSSNSKPQHIYITNDKETLSNNGDYYLGYPDYNTIHKWDMKGIHEGKQVWIKKIILTTDPDLISDGIAQISEDVLLKIVEHINSGKNIESFDEL